MEDVNTEEPKETCKIKTVRIVKLLMVREKSVKYRQAMSSAQTVVDIVRPLFKNCYREQVLVVGLDNQNLPTVIHLVGVGSPNQSPVFLANVFKPLLLSNSSAFILCHNHPGGKLSASGADRELTDRLIEIGKLLDLPMLDHIILNADSSEHLSFRSAGMINA